MQTISLKISDQVLMRIDECIEKHNYSTKSEFIRDAIRDKLETLENQKFESEIRDYLNKSSKNVEIPHKGVNPSAELEKAKNDIFLELERKFELLREHLKEK
jgi:Arc/MetJ-type ribon-helix-helix transcriptional regulator